MSRRAVDAPPFPCLQSPEVRRAYELCEAAYDEEEYKSLAESPLPEPRPRADDTPEWWQRYEVDIWNNKSLRVWLKPLTRPESDMTFEDAAKGIYSLAGLTQAESDAVLLHHEGFSWRQIARKFDLALGSIQDRISSGEAKLAALKEL